MRYEIHGTVMQTLDVYLSPNESMYTESGGMAWMKGNIDMQTNTKGGLMAGLGRKLAGESLFMTTYANKGSNEALVVFTPEAPGKVLPVKLGAGQSMICQRDAFMCAESSVNLMMHFRKRLGSGLFGGEGFILQKITGPGYAFLEIPGEIREYTLAAGETMRIDPGHIALFEPTLDHEITMVKGLTNIFFGGEGLFLAIVKGPGRIWLQSMPLSNLAGKLAKYMPTKSS
ncbi:MAG: TIGR00266 family protein [Anaerolineae bacterium]